MYFFTTFLVLVEVTWDWVKKVVWQVDDLSFFTFFQKSEKKWKKSEKSKKKYFQQLLMNMLIQNLALAVLVEIHLPALRLN